LTEIVPLTAIDTAGVEHLLDLAFGADRHRRTAYRLREGVAALPGLSFAAIEKGRLIGSIQCWPVELMADGGAIPLILVGPVAVHPDRQRTGIGRRLMHAALDAADAAGSEPMVLIGDAEYYDRFFGFSARHTAGWTAPGPIDRNRLLARIRPGQRLPAEAALGPRRLDQPLVGDDD